MATLILKSLQCIRKHDLTGNDEPEIVVGTDSVWRGAMAKGETEILTNGRADETDFSGEILVYLFESTRRVSTGYEVDDAPTNTGRATFKTSGTHYELEYRVVA